MSLTKKDLTLIKGLMSDTLKPEFDKIDQRFDKVDRRFDEVDQRFGKIEDRMTNMENTLTAAFREIVNDIYDLHPSKEEFDMLESRVTYIEHKIN